MHNHKLRIVSDKFDEYKESMGAYGMTDSNAIPVDLYGKRIFPDKNNPSNLTDAAEDIKEYYKLEGTGGLKGSE